VETTLSNSASASSASVSFGGGSLQGSYTSWKVLELYTSGSGIVSSGLSSREADKQLLLIHCHLLGQIKY